MNIYIVDAFTNEKYNGNPAGVVLDDTNINECEMQKIASELNLSETAFLKKTHEDGIDYHIRYFTPTEEIAFCGHATLASSWLLGTLLKKDKIILKNSIGKIPIDLKYQEDNLEMVYFEINKPKIKAFYDESVFDMVGIPLREYDDILGMKMIYSGQWDLIIPIKSQQAIKEAIPDLKRIKEHGIKHNILSIHLYTINCENDDYTIYCRNFSPACGIDEDIVTGSTNGSLATHLIEKGIIAKKQFKIKQKSASGRYGIISVKYDKATDKLCIGGKAVIVLEGKI